MNKQSLELFKNEQVIPLLEIYDRLRQQKKRDWLESLWSEENRWPAGHILALVWGCCFAMVQANSVDIFKWNPGVIVGVWILFILLTVGVPLAHSGRRVWLPRFASSGVLLLLEDSLQAHKIFNNLAHGLHLPCWEAPPKNALEFFSRLVLISYTTRRVLDEM